MTPGTVLFDANFLFYDGTKGRKIFIILNDGTEGKYVSVKTTSRGDRYGIQHGCQPMDRYPNFYLVKGSCFLQENTWIQLDNFFEFDSAQMMQKVISGQINRIGVLSSEQALQLLICTTHSEDMSLSQEIIIQRAVQQMQN
ncbi:hypothetical protein [Methylophaga sp.]|uniref:hypothetical protein n=1 Tax=Methylophaga sp. TaxID=2024840 RepID=UPI003A8C9AE4